MSASPALIARARSASPGGVHSNVRLSGPSVFIERAKGAWLYDVDGKDYVDHMLGQGPNFLGHADERVNRAVAAAASTGTIIGGQHPLEVAAAEEFLGAVPWADMVRFGLSGTEADQAAFRLARAATGRTAVVRFTGSYQGWLDNVLVEYRDEARPASRGQLDQDFQQTVFLPYNDLAALTRTLEERDDIAAVVVEPVMCNSAAIQPEGTFLSDARELCDRTGTVLIFDEVITGFRLALGGAAEYYGVQPDLAVYGKALAGGWPVSALAGRAEIMSLLEEGVNHSGTFNSSIPACAAVRETIRVLREDAPYARIEKHGAALREIIRTTGERHGLPLRSQGVAAAFHVSFGPAGAVTDHAGTSAFDAARYARFSRILVEEGIWVAERGIWYVSAAHGPAELEAVAERLERAAGRA